MLLSLIWISVVVLAVSITILTIGGVWATNYSDWREEAGVISAIIAGVFGFTALLLLLAFGLTYPGAEVKAKLINREYGTNYTVDEIYYGSSVIETIQQLQRQRIEINGNLLQDK